MNFFKKIYCRVYQGIFRIALPFLPYREPKLLKDNEEVAGIIKEMGLKKALIVTDKTLYNLGLTLDLEKALSKSDIEYIVYSDTVANPTTKNVEDALLVYKNEECDLIIAFGGGSSMDCAKAVGARVVRPNKTLNKMKGLLKIRKKLPLLIAIPTTAGTGSETTLAAVITDAETRHKYAINDFSLIPHFALLDAKLTVNLPPFVTATTGMDALTHAVEAYIGKSTTKDTRKNALEATKLIFENLLDVYHKGQNLEKRKNMLVASYKAGLAAHSLGGKYNVAHGFANAVILPIMLKKYGKSVYKKLYELGLYAGLFSKDASYEEASNIFIKKIEEFNTQMNIGDKIPGIRKEDIEELAQTAEREANPLYPVPKLFTAKELENVYLDIMA